MGFTSDACWFLLIKTLLIKNNKKREAGLKNEAGGDEKHVFFLLGLSAASVCGAGYSWAIRVNHAAEHLCCVVILNPFLRAISPMESE